MDPVSGAFTLLSGAASGLEALQVVVGSKIERENLRTRQAQERIAATENSIKRSEELARVLSANTARAAAGGIDLTSPSFRSIQANDFNAFNEDEKLDSLNLQTRERFLSSKIRASSRNEFASLINLAGEQLSRAARRKFGEI